MSALSGITKSGKCSNFGNCSAADSYAVIQIPNGADFVCKECGKPLLLTGVINKPSKKAPTVAALVAILSLLSGGIWLMISSPSGICPNGQVGTPPNCKKPTVDSCPDGQVGTPPNCKKPTVDSCPDGQVGTPPNCFTRDKVDTSSSCTSLLAQLEASLQRKNWEAERKPWTMMVELMYKIDCSDSEKERRNDICEKQIRSLVESSSSDVFNCPKNYR